MGHKKKQQEEEQEKKKPQEQEQQQPRRPPQLLSRTRRTRRVRQRSGGVRITKRHGIAHKCYQALRYALCAVAG